MEQLSSTSYSGPSRREILGTCSITGRMESDGIFSVNALPMVHLQACDWIDL